MATYIPKKRGDILRNALKRIENETPIKTTTVGSVARSFTEAITTEIADFYDILEYNVAQNNLSTATGRHLDLIGQTYNIERTSVTNSTEINRNTGSFYFYVDNTAPAGGITIPANTRVYTSSNNFIGRQLSYVTTADVTIPAGEKRAYASIRPDFGTNEVTAGVGTLTVHDAYIPGHVVHCTNPKPIYSQATYESDANFRSRIIKRLAVQATGGTDSIRFAILGMPNVRDVRVYSNRLGLGVAEVVLVPEEGGFSQKELSDIKKRLESVRAAGVKTIISLPQTLSADIKALIFINRSAVTQGAEATVLTAIHDLWGAHINGLLPGETLVYNKLIDLAFNVSEKVLDVTITDFKVGGSTVIRGSYTPKPDQMIIPGELDVAVSFFA